MTYLDFDQRNTDLNDMEKEQLNNDDERQALLDNSVHAGKKAGGLLAANLQKEKEAKVGASKDPFRVNNKQEGLFCRGRVGVNKLIIASTQFFYLTTILFMAFKLATVNQEYIDLKGDSTKIIIHSCLLGFAVIIMLYIWLGIVPSMLTSFTITTNIEMMKDRHCMHKVIAI
jgi:hypothetical protein